MSFFPGATGQQTAAVLNTTGGSPYDPNPSAASGLPDPGRIGSFFHRSAFQSCLFIPCFPVPIRPPLPGLPIPDGLALSSPARISSLVFLSSVSQLQSVRCFRASRSRTDWLLLSPLCFPVLFIYPLFPSSNPSADAGSPSVFGEKRAIFVFHRKSHFMISFQQHSLFQIWLKRVIFPFLSVRFCQRTAIFLH